VGDANTPSLTWYRRTRVATNYSFPATAAAAAAAAAGDGGDGDGDGADADAVDKMSCKDAVITQQQQQRRDHVTSAASLAAGQPINDVGGRARRSTTCCSLNTGFAVTARVCLCRSLSLSLSLRLDVSVPVRLPTCLPFTRQLQVAGNYINRSPLNLKVRETFI